MKLNNSLIRIYKYIKEYEQRFLGVFIIFTITEILYCFLNAIIPKMMVETLYFDKEETHFTEIFLFFLVSMCLLGYIKTITLNISNSKITRIKNHYAKKLFEKITNLKYQYIEDADFLNNNNSTFSVVEDYDGGIEGVCHILFSLPANFILCIFFVGILGKLNLIIVLALLIDWAIKLKIYKRFSNRMYSKKQDIGNSKRHMNYYYKISNDFNFGKDIRLFKIKKNILNDYIKEINKYIQTLKKLYKIQLNLENIDILFGIVCDFIMVGILIFSVWKGTVSIPNFTMYITIINMLKTSLQNTNEDISKLLCELPYIDDFFKFIDEGDLDESNSHNPIELKNNLRIKLENVSFKYPNSDKLVLDHMNFEINAGEKIAIVGANGTGKSTIVKLLMKFYSPSDGIIKVNDIDIKEIDINYLRSLYSVIFQDICIYPFSIQENITCCEENFDERKLEISLKNTNLYEKIERLQNGAKSKLIKSFHPEGIDLSGGEKQKMAIARAIYKDAPIAIFDEPTSALDAIAEEDLYKRLCYLLENKTVIFISHRLTSICFCDKIILFKDGTVAESGTYTELMQLKGEFYKMFKAQGKYYEI